MPQWINAYKSLISKPRDQDSASFSQDEIKRLPFSVTDARILKNDAPVAFIVSGDGGWYHFEQSISDQLANLGIPSIGLDSKRYFWNRKSPDQTAEDVAHAMNYYSRKYGKDRFVFIGYSLGAEVIPFIINRLPSDMKAKVASAVLLSPSNLTDFEIHVSDMLGINNRADSYDVVREIGKLKGCSILAIFGDEEKTKVPKQLEQLSCIVRIVPGDHHYKFDTPLLIKTMRDNHFF
jgi:type IV secretory pathway VirJ component